MKDEILRQVLIKLMKEGLLNKFVETIFSYKLNENDEVYIQYKIANGNITMNIFDNVITNRFNGYVFLDEDSDNYIKSDIENNTSINFIYLKKCLSLYNENHYQNNLILFGVWLLGIDTLDKIFSNDILEVFRKIEKEYS